MEKLPVFRASDDDLAAEYLSFLLHVELVQLTDGTHKSEEPARNTTLNYIPGDRDQRLTVEIDQETLGGSAD